MNKKSVDMVQVLADALMNGTKNPKDIGSRYQMDVLVYLTTHSFHPNTDKKRLEFITSELKKILNLPESYGLKGTKIPMPSMRKPMYAFLDGVVAIEMAVNREDAVKDDQKLKLLLEAVRRATDAFQDHVSFKYNWD